MSAVAAMARSARSGRGAESGPVREARAEPARVEHARIADIQHARILAAIGDVACERGAAGVAVADVVQRAGVSRRTFYDEFAGIEDCLLAALEQALEQVGARVLPAYGTDGDGAWRERVRSALWELLCSFDEQPVLARLLVVESLSAGPRALRFRARVQGTVSAELDAGGRGVAAPAAVAGVTRLTAEGLVGAVLSVIHSRLAGGGEVELTQLLNPLMSAIVLPYLGAAQARRELDRPAPRRAPAVERVGGAESPRSDPFKAVGARLTYRTVLVLSAIAAEPGASNRRIGVAAGVGDQGQISKLLARLERLGLIANSGPGHFKGEPNAWSLTDKGRQFEQSIRAHTGASRGQSRQKGRE